MAKNIGEVIRNARVQLKLTQEEAARRANMSPPAFNRLELGCGDPRWSTVVRVARGLGMTLDELAGGYVDRAAMLQPAVSMSDVRGELRVIKRDLDAATTRLGDLEARLGRPATRKRSHPTAS